MKLIQMNGIEFESYKEKGIISYKDELVRMGMDSEQALEQAKASYNRLLPKGVETENNFLYNAFDGDNKIGFIWYAVRDGNNAFIYDFFINDQYRRKGYGKKVMLECENEVKEKGITSLQLHVFGHNIGARKLYKSLGYYPTSIQMSKDLV